MVRLTPERVQAEAAIHSVIQHLIDSQEALVEIGENLQNLTLRRFFFVESLKRAEFRGELGAILNQEGVSDMRDSGTAVGAVRRAWAELKAKLRAGDHALLATAAEAEDEAEEAYIKAIDTSLPLPVREVLTAQAAQIHHSYEYVKSALLRTRATAA
jgi:uncharacterized protein (TIGR02284 family)